MHVLRQLHKTLRPDGVLLDIHPQPEDPRVVIVGNGRRNMIGELDATIDNQEIRDARKRLVSVLRSGLFRTEERRIFSFHKYYESVEEWLELRRERGSTNIIPSGVLRAARRELRAEGTQLAVATRIRATVLRRLALP